MDSIYPHMNIYEAAIFNAKSVQSKCFTDTREPTKSDVPHMMLAMSCYKLHPYRQTSSGK